MFRTLAAHLRAQWMGALALFLVIAGVVVILDRLAGGAERIRDAAGDVPYEPLATIDDIYPDRPDR